LADCREKVDASKLFGGIVDVDAAIGLEPFDAAHRGKVIRNSKLVSKLIGFRIDFAYIATDARTEGETIEGHTVTPEGGLTLGGTAYIIPIILIKIAPGHHDHIVRGLKNGITH